MKQVAWVILGWFTLLVTAQADVTSKVWPSTPWPSKKGAVVIQPFNLDDLSTIKELGYEATNGQRLNGSGNDELWSQEYCVFNRDDFPTRPVRFVSCVIVIQTMLRRDANGHPVWKSEDAIQINFNGNILTTFDSGDTNCSSSLYPDRSVFAIGLWKSRKPPQVGGYAHSLRNAWIVDPETKKLKAIPTNGVRCEVNEDRD